MCPNGNNKIFQTQTLSQQIDRNLSTYLKDVLRKRGNRRYVNTDRDLRAGHNRGRQDDTSFWYHKNITF